MISARYRGLWLLLVGVVTGLLALAALTAVALAGTPGKSGAVSTVLPMPYTTVVEAVRAVGADGVIRGTAQYDSDTTINGANPAPSSPSFPRWAGSGAVFYKTRPGAIAPSHFAGARDRGAVTVRYVVEPAQPGQTRIMIDAVFVEGTRHGSHRSLGFVEKAEFAEIARHLNPPGALGNGPASEALEREPEPHTLTQALQDPGRQPEEVVPSPAPAAVNSRAVLLSAPVGRGRTYSRAEADLKKALQELGAFDDAALPVLEGFATLGPDRLVGYDRPYYRFRVEFEPAGSGRTVVRVEAVVTARFTDAPGSRPEYRAVPSNGRLETDLFDRLDGYMRLATGAAASGAASLRQQDARSSGNK